MKIPMCIFSIVMIAGFPTFAQTQTPSLANSTWNVEYTFCGDTEYTRHVTIKLLSTGRIAGSKAGRWRLVRNKLVISNDSEDYITSLSATVRGGVATGKGLLGMNPREFCVRLAKLSP